MTRAALTIVLGALAVLVAAHPAASSGTEGTAPGPCKESTVGGVRTHTYCGPARATVKLAGKTIAFKGGNCGVASGSLVSGWGLGVGRYTVPPAKPRFKYFGVAYVGVPKAGTYTKGEFVITFFVPGKTYSVIGSPLGAPALKVTVTKGARKGSFTGVASGSKKVSGQWTC
jgi:hypothetical protein